MRGPCHSGRPCESVGDLHAVAQRLGHAEPARRDDALERSSFGVLHDDEVDAAIRTDVVDGDDVGVVECARSLRFREEAPFPVRIDDSVLGKDLDGHRAIEVGVEGPVNDPHPTLAELRFDPVAIQRPTNHRDARMPGYLRPFRRVDESIRVDAGRAPLPYLTIRNPVGGGGGSSGG